MPAAILRLTDNNQTLIKSSITKIGVIPEPPKGKLEKSRNVKL
jgi:hypothetical protein